MFAESIVQTVREPLVVLDQDLRVKLVNQAFYRTFEVFPDETENRFLYELGAGEWNIRGLRRALEEILPQKSQFEDYEVDHEFPRIGRRVMLLNARRIVSGDGSPDMILLAIEDVTARRQTEKLLAQQTRELERSNADLQQFAYVASHDLQEPLRMVASYTQLLAKRYKGHIDRDADDFIHYIVDGVNRMQALINDLLAYSRAGAQVRELKPTDCEAVLRQVLGDLGKAIEISRGVVTHDPLPTVMADASQLGQLFLNLVGNALKFHGAEPLRVHVSAERRGKEWVFTVRDNGIGIEPQYFERIFIIFQRLHGRGDYPGTGIGLALCKKIVQRHGGKIWLESAVGKGTTFFFTIPALDRAKQ